MEKEAKILAAIFVITIGAVFGGAFLLSKTTPPADTQLTTLDNQPTADAKLLVRDNSHKKGAENPKVTIVEFADFQCPACASAHPIIARLLTDFPNDVQLIYRHFPLRSIHKNAFMAALASEAAGSQGKYWEMYDKLYETQSEWSDLGSPKDFFVNLAKGLSLDTDKFKKSLEASEFAARVSEDEKDAISLGVNSTPTFYINGVKQKGFLEYNAFKALIEDAIK